MTRSSHLSFGIVLCLGLMAWRPLRSQSAFSPPSDSARPQLRAVRTRTAVRIDGELKDSVWRVAPVARGFRQVEPDQLEPAHDSTDVRVAYDRRYLYVAFWAFDSAGTSKLRVPNLRRDFDFGSSDMVAVVLDPFCDRRNAVSFQTTPHGNQRDLLVFDDNLFDRDWDTQWRVRTRRSETGWTAEFAIPWASVRYPKVMADSVVWGLQLMRNARRRNEITGWSPWPRAYSLYRMAYAGDLIGLTPPPPSRVNLRVQPYLTTTLNQRRVDGAGPDAVVVGQAGGELRWAPSPSDVVDVTVNTDFAQADVDRQVNNLTRFSVFFPERRQFFLENSGLFQIGLSGQAQPFFSRRIGLADDGSPIGIDVGGRYVSRTLKRSIGALAVRQRATLTQGPADFAVARYQQNLGKQNRIGALVTYRQDEPTATRARLQNQTYSLDGFFRLSQDVGVEFSASNSQTQGLSSVGGVGNMGHIWASYSSNDGYLGYVFGLVSPDYNPAVGFVGRTNYVYHSPAGWVNWRPKWRGKHIRAFEPGGGADLYYGMTDGHLQEGRAYAYPIFIRWHGDQLLSVTVERNWQVLTQAFRPLDAQIAAGRYTYERARVQYNSDQSKVLAINVDWSWGGYFDGQLLTGTSTLRWSPRPQVSLGATHELQALEQVGIWRSNRSTHLIGPEVRLAANPRLQLYGFYQYNTFGNVGRWNVRLSWEFAPLSFVYLVFNSTAFDGVNPEKLTPQRVHNVQGLFKLTYVHQFWAARSYMGSLRKPQRWKTWLRETRSTPKPYLTERWKLIDEASLKYLVGQVISPMGKSA
jgi:hypothetical protein